MRTLKSPVTVFIVFFLIYILTITSNFTGPHDSMTYLLMLKTKEHLFHPHHLIYHWLSFFWLEIVSKIFPNVQEYFLVESFDTVFGSATLAVAFLFFLRRFELPVLTSWIGTAIIAFNFGIWFYSINIEVYAPSLFFTLCCLYILTKKEWTPSDLWLIAVLHSISILFHQMNILLTPVILYKIFVQRKNLNVLKSIVLYGLTGILIVGTLYILAGWFGEGNKNISDLIRWIRGYTATDEYWRGLSIKTPLYAGIGFSHAILGGHFVFKIGSEHLINSILKSHSLDDEYYLAKNLSRTAALVLFALAMMLVACIVYLIIRFVTRLKALMLTKNYLLIPLILYLVIYSVYFLFWMPEILEFWLGQCIVFWLILIGTIPNPGRKTNIFLSLILLLLAVINYASSIRPMENINNDIGYARIVKVKNAANDKDLIIVQDPWLLKEFLQYYTKSKVIVVPESTQDSEALSQLVDRTLNSGNKIYIFPDVTTDHGSKNLSFIPDLVRKYQSRTGNFQTELRKVLVIK